MNFERMVNYNQADGGGSDTKKSKTTILGHIDPKLDELANAAKPSESGGAVLAFWAGAGKVLANKPAEFVHNHGGWFKGFTFVQLGTDVLYENKSEDTPPAEE